MSESTPRLDAPPVVSPPVEPLMRVIANQQRQLIDQAEMIGALRAEIASRHASQVASATGWRRWRAWLAAGLVVAVVGSASCQTAGPLANAPTICAAARQDVALWEGRAKRGQAVRPEGVWIDEWSEITTLVAFIKTYC
jgi:hypothetical protein